jgi:S-formylglutathione hydrolase FrmB
MPRILIVVLLNVVGALWSQFSAANPSADPAIKPTPPLASRGGKVVTRTFHSTALGVDKSYLVYLPRDYDSRLEVRWPVFYYLNGLLGDETAWVKVGHLDAAADALGLDAIVVMPDGDDGFYVDTARVIDYEACMKDGTGLYRPTEQSRDHSCVRHHAYESYIVKDLIADVDAAYRTIAARDARAIAGLSMGGFGALELGMRHLDVFAAAASHSGVAALLYAGPHPYAAGSVRLVTDPRRYGADTGTIGAWVRGIFGGDLATWQAYDPALLAGKLKPGQLAIYLDCATGDSLGLNDNISYLHDLLTAGKIDHVFYLGPGGHDFTFWRARVPESLKFLGDHLMKPRAR